MKETIRLLRLMRHSVREHEISTFLETIELTNDPAMWSGVTNQNARDYSAKEDHLQQGV